MESVYVQIIVVVFVLFALSRAWLRFKDSKIKWQELIFWNVVWIGALIVVFLPQSANFLAGLLGIGRGVDVIIYGGLIIVFYLVFRLYVKVENIEQEITTMTREVALKELPGKKGKKKGK